MPTIARLIWRVRTPVVVLLAMRVASLVLGYFYDPSAAELVATEAAYFALFGCIAWMLAGEQLKLGSVLKGVVAVFGIDVAFVAVNIIIAGLMPRPGSPGGKRLVELALGGLLLSSAMYLVAIMALAAVMAVLRRRLAGVPR